MIATRGCRRKKKETDESNDSTVGEQQRLEATGIQREEREKHSGQTYT